MVLFSLNFAFTKTISLLCRLEAAPLGPSPFAEIPLMWAFKYKPTKPDTYDMARKALVYKLKLILTHYTFKEVI